MRTEPSERCFVLVSTVPSLPSPPGLANRSNLGRDVTMQIGLASIDEERWRRETFLSEPDGSVGRALDDALASLNDAGVRAAIQPIRSFAASLHYDHPGQSKEVYLAHPTRVATMYLRSVESPDDLGLGIALLHNVLEVADVDRTQLAEEVGIEIADAVQLLTVHRPREWEAEYKEIYYGRIAAARLPVRAVKVLDKLDNLFLLHRNPDEALRLRYLAEIEEHLLPLAHRDLPQVATYIEDLVEDNRRVSHLPPRADLDRQNWGGRHG